MATNAVCREVGCDQLAKSRGLCNAHYCRWRYQQKKQEYINRAAEWKRCNPEKVSAGGRRRYNADPDKIRRINDRWRAANPEKVRDIRENNRARRRDAFVEHVDREERWGAYGGKCGICGEPVALPEMELDHIVPISRGGLHERKNCQPAHMTCNRRKFNFVPEAKTNGE